MTTKPKAATRSADETPREPSTCDHCGKTDDHPKVHAFTGETYHHDCLPYQMRESMVHDPKVAAIIEAAEGGTHGDDLVTFIQNQGE